MLTEMNTFCVEYHLREPGRQFRCSQASCAGSSCLGAKSRAARAIPTRLPDKRFYDRYAGRRIGALGGTGFMRMLSRKFPCLSEASLELAAKFERSIETRSAAPCGSRHTCQEPLDPAGSDSGRAGRLLAPAAEDPARTLQCSQRNCRPGSRNCPLCVKKCLQFSAK